MNIDLNLEDVFELDVIHQDLNRFSFHSPVERGNEVRILVLIQEANNPFLQEFLNIAFGPEKIDGQDRSSIDDFISIKHQNPSKVLSTVLFCGILYLKSNPDKYIGVDGSDFRRAYLYYRTIQRNLNYLTERFALFGIKYWARVIRAENKTEPMTVDITELTYIPYSLENHPLRNHKSLFI